MKRSLLLLFLFLGSTNALNAQSSLMDLIQDLYDDIVIDGRIDYKEAKTDRRLAEVVKKLENEKWEDLEDSSKKAFLTNAYNILVIKGVVDEYPVASIMKIPAFFDAQRYFVAGRKVSLNELEKDWLFREFPDARLHFALICGAKGCPPFPPEVFRAEALDKQLDEQARYAINDPSFIKRENGAGSLVVSQIFQWYGDDFRKAEGSVKAYIEKYETGRLPDEFNISYGIYDWSLNDIEADSGDLGNNQFRYVVSATIPKGTTETKLFNNLYTQTIGDGSFRSTFFTSFLTSLYGVTDRISAGIELRYRMVHNGGADATQWDVFQFSDAENLRNGITTIGPKVRFAPVPKWSNFSVQSALWIPLKNDWEGTAVKPYIDWNGLTWWTQFFNDFPIGSQFSVFTEIDILWEDISTSEEGYNRLSTPVTVIGSFFPNKKTTLYALANWSPYLTTEDGYFWQAGMGAKYQFTRNFEIEVLYNYFTNRFLNENDGNASTLNFGIRVNR